MSTKLKYFIRGLGTGILFAAVIMSISFAIMSDDLIIEKAKKLGMVMTDSKNDVEKNLDKLATASSFAKDEKKEDENADAKQTTTPKPDNKASKSPNNNTSQDKTKEPKDNKSAKPTKNNKTSDEVEIVVKAGMSSYDVAKQLEDKGIVKSAGEFDRYMYDNEYDSKLLNGTFKIKKGDSYKEIIKKLLD